MTRVTDDASRHLRGNDERLPVVDIVGQGKADTGALEQALRIAARMAAARQQQQEVH